MWLTGGLVAIAAVVISILSAPSAIGVLGAGLALVAMAIAVVDWRSFVIPDALNAAGLVLAMVHAAARQPDIALWAMAMALMRGAVVALMFLAVRIVYAQVRGRQGLGLGDVKLAVVAGAWLDWMMIPIAIELSVLAALCGYLFRQFAMGRSISLTNRVPFGVFLAPAIWTCWIVETSWLH
jgi:leader peptidase (prepilin peptidase)/N-methyltransferase